MLIVIVAIGAILIALIGLGGSYLAVRDVAFQKGMGDYSKVFPIGVDVGIIVLLTLDLVLAWLRIPFAPLRPTAWLFTAATIAFNASASWPDPIGVGMHAVIPVTFIVVSEAGRHAVARIAKLDSDRAMEKLRTLRWFLAPRQTWTIWRDMYLWEVTRVDDALLRKQAILAYKVLLKDAPVSPGGGLPAAATLPLELAAMGVPIELTYTAGLAAAGVDSTPLDRIFASRRTALDVDQSELTVTAVPRTRSANAGQRRELTGVEGEIPPSGSAELTSAVPEKPAVAEAPAAPELAAQPANDHLAYAGADLAGLAGADASGPELVADPQDAYAYSQVSSLAGTFAGRGGETGDRAGSDDQLASAFAYAAPDELDTRTALAGQRTPEPVRAAAAYQRVTRSSADSLSVVGSRGNTSPVQDDDAPKVVIPEVWITAFSAWVERYERYPSEEELAEYLYNLPEKERVRARGADRPVSKRSVERYYGDLKKMFPLADQPQLELEGAGR
ncbi:DUF2637 domain-containing protein [Streptomyces sp. NRRL S-350]|uniref:DUF2637 domain-containing protein n=1 Tax=Streptomyces sp. NRRL S-350 TaxID=1463902 RepID=UPI00068D759A|nr:DUF2637 domain-containing protein [Streptomyces sp. NRRL S-350]